jgi:hypothetical protein
MNSDILRLKLLLHHASISRNRPNITHKVPTVQRTPSCMSAMSELIGVESLSSFAVVLRCNPNFV